jgi:very-short-patch-repair endonuclease
MRRLFTTEEAAARGLTPAALSWGDKNGRWRRIEYGVYGEGPDEPSELDRARAIMHTTAGVASGRVAGALLGLDSVEIQGVDVTVAPGGNRRRKGVRRRKLPPERIVTVHGVRCTDGLQTLIDLAAELDDLAWEQALESTLRKGLATVRQWHDALPDLRRSRTPGARRIARVLALRPEGAPATGSLLETLMVQLIRLMPTTPEPRRQVTVTNAWGEFVAHVDLAWPALGVFIELDGEHHRGQPVYDASRETAVVAATGWLCGRFTWTEVTRYPKTTARRLAMVLDQARRRPVGS